MNTLLSSICLMIIITMIIMIALKGAVQDFYNLHTVLQTAPTRMHAGEARVQSSLSLSLSLTHTHTHTHTHTLFELFCI